MKIYTNENRILVSLIILLIFILLNCYAYIVEDSFTIINFALSVAFSAITSIIFAVKLEINEKYNKYFTLICFLLSIFLSYLGTELLNLNNPFGLNYKCFIFNIIVIIFSHMFIYALSNKLSLSIMLSNMIIYMLCAVNYVLLCFRDTPFVPLDILSIKTGINVASSYTFKFSYIFLVATSMFILSISLGSKCNCKFKSKKKNTIIRSLILFIVLVFTLTIYNTNVLSYFDFVSNEWDLTDEYCKNGFLGGFIRQSTKYTNIKPNNYSAKLVENILYSNNTSYDNDYSNISEKPNIIVIMNESFSDLSVNR